MEKSFSSILEILFKLACIGGAIYMGFVLISRYRQNEDVTAVLIKRLNDSPKDKHPAITLCLTYPGTLLSYKHYSRQTVKGNLSLGPMEFYNLLQGNIEDADNKLEDTNFENATKVLQYYLDGFVAAYERNETFEVLKGNNIPFFKSYQDPNYQCYSYEATTNASYGVLMRLVYTFDLSKVKKLKWGFMYVFIHQPGQFIRSTDQMNKWTFKLDRLHTFAGNNSQFNQAEININQIKVLRSRPNAKIPCDPDLEKDDAKLMRIITDLVGFVPPYWQKLHGIDKEDVPLCNSTTQLREERKYHLKQRGGGSTRAGLLRINSLFGGYIAPCDQMDVISSVNAYKQEINKKLKLKIIFNLLTKKYEEVQNLRAYGMDSLWAEVGGYIGIFLGYSILHVIELMLMLPKWIQENVATK